MKLELALLAGKPDFGEARCLASWGREARVAAAAEPSACKHDARLGGGQVGDEHGVGIADLRADRQRELDRLSVCAMLARPATVAAATSCKALARTERRQVAQRRVSHGDNVAAATAVTAVRPALRHELLAAEAEPTVAAAARPDIDVRPV